MDRPALFPVVVGTPVIEVMEHLGVAAVAPSKGSAKAVSPGPALPCATRADALVLQSVGRCCHGHYDAGQRARVTIRQVGLALGSFNRLSAGAIEE